MNKSIEISGNRIALIEAYLQFNRPEIDKVANQLQGSNPLDKTSPNPENEPVFPSVFDEYLINEKEDLSKPTVDKVTIYSDKYQKEATVLNQGDLLKIQDAIQELFLELRQTPYSISDYYC